MQHNNKKMEKNDENRVNEKQNKNNQVHTKYIKANHCLLSTNNIYNKIQRMYLQV